MATYLQPGLDGSIQGEQSLLHPLRYRPPASAGPSSVVGGRLVVDHLPALASHRGAPPDLVVRWGPLPRSGSVDVVVHLHGFSARRGAMTLPRDVEPVSGLDLADPERPGTAGRRTPTVLVLPRGHFSGGRSGNAYTFPALQAPGAVGGLADDALRRVGARTGAQLRRGRLILTAHSGGGAALMAILRHTDPHEVFAYDALYTDPAPLIEWARRRQSSGTGAMRVIYRAGEGTARNSARVAGAVPRSARFRVESTTVAHGAIPRRFGWRLLADPGADLPGTSGHGGGHVPPAPPTPPAPPAGQLAAALVRVAEGEYRRWRPGGGPALTETSAAASPILREYYRDGVGGTVTDAQMRSAAYQGGHPWSAVFISYVVEKAGGGAQFHKSAAHQGYIRAARENRLRARADNPFWAYRADEVAPQPGDIVCAARAGSGATYDNIGDPTHRATHCDVVVERRPGTIRVVGGNVGNTVGAKTLRLRPDGRLDLTGNQASFFAVIRCGAGAPARRQPGTPPRAASTLEDRVRRVMHLLVRQHGYTQAAAAGVVGNLMAESQVMPDRIEGSREATPLRAQDFGGTVRDFTLEEVRDRDVARRRGPRLPGVGLAQWTSRARREGLFAHTYRGVRPGAAILRDLDAQVDYLVTELRTRYAQVDAVLRRPGTTLEQASDVVLLRFEVPASVLHKPVTDPGVQRVLAQRRALGARALQIVGRGTP